MIRVRLAALALCWAVSASPLRAIDGDTFEATIAIWPGLTTHERVRLLGVDTPERGRLGYQEAKDFLGAWLTAGDVMVATCRRDSFGRILGTVTRGPSGENVADALLRAGHGRAR